jgi:hypothetical protein
MIQRDGGPALQMTGKIVRDDHRLVGPGLR